jgi:protein-L-isoaspartate O-methyltransferase
MYATVLEALELTHGMSFLNVGSGSGYLSCLAACMLGECGLSHGVDVNQSVVIHSEQCCKVWFAGLTRRREEGESGVPKVSKEGVSFVHGNCFHLDIASSVHTCRYDRIYVGAGCPEARKEFFFSLLADDGILVASINERNELIQVRRRHRHIFTETVISNVIFAPLIEPVEELEFGAQRPLTFPMLQMRRQRSGTMSSVTTNASTISSVLDWSMSPRRTSRGASIGGETEASVSSAEESALLSSMSSSPPSNTISLSASPLSSLLTESHLNSLLRATHIPNTHLGFSMSLLNTASANAATSTSSAAHPASVPGAASGTAGTAATTSAPNSSRSDVSAGNISALDSSRSNVTPVRLPPVLWAPTASRHAQFPQTFKRAVLTLLIASRRPISFETVPSSLSSSSSAMVTRRCLCGAIPLHIWVHIISFASRWDSLRLFVAYFIS